MLCKKPFRSGLMEHGCGQCTPCRINRNKTWAHRMVLETYAHERNSFVTLTYAIEPEGATLVPNDLRLFLMRLRSLIYPQKVRYYACGEYGGQGRPHYHLALFGLGPEDEEIIQKAWSDPETKRPLGFIVVGTLTFDSAQYIAKYIQKGRTKQGDPSLNGRHPEFSRMSLKPGIGALAVSDIGDSLTTSAGAELILSHGDVPRSLKHGKRNMPLGRYLRKKIRHYLGLDHEEIKKDLSKKKSEEMLALRKAAKAATDCPSEQAEIIHRWKAKKQKILNLETKAKIHNKGGIL